MENQSGADNKQLVIAIPADQTNLQLTEDHENAAAAATKKKRGRMQILQVAMFLLRRRPGKSSKAPSVEAVASSKGTWKRLVGSMRPLHLQGNQSSPPPPNDNPSLFEIAAPTTPTGSELGYEDVLPPPPMSPAHSTGLMSTSSSEDGIQSRYASAVNLQELDRSEQDDGKLKGANIYGGDDQIDVKAEEFIAQFYQQMKLQRSDSRVPRSIGWTNQQPYVPMPIMHAHAHHQYIIKLKLAI